MIPRRGTYEGRMVIAIPVARPPINIHTGTSERAVAASATSTKRSAAKSLNGKFRYPLQKRMSKAERARRRPRPQRRPGQLIVAKRGPSTGAISEKISALKILTEVDEPHVKAPDSARRP